MNIRYVILMIVAVLFVAGCGSTPTTPAVSTPQSTPTQPAIVTVTSQPTDSDATQETDSTDQNQQDSYPAPTSPSDVQTQSNEYPAPTDCSTPAQPFAGLLESQPDLQQTFGCATSDAVQTNAAWQVFENENQMVWLENEDAILAMYNEEWHAHEDTFEENTDPEFPPNAPTPSAENRYRAKRGFGKVWINAVDEIGFAVSEEEAYDATIQQFEGGWMVTTPFGQVFALEGMTDAQTGTGPYQAWLERDGEWVSGATAN